jgi:hypothetical protein
LVLAGDKGVAVVEFVSRSYNFCYQIPTSIVEELGAHRVRTTTYLETSQITIQSGRLPL